MPINVDPNFVIQRSSESRCEFWTGSDWSQNELDAQRYFVEPNPGEETGDESATAEVVDAEPFRDSGRGIPGG